MAATWQQGNNAKLEAWLLTKSVSSHEKCRQHSNKVALVVDQHTPHRTLPQTLPVLALAVMSPPQQHDLNSAELWTKSSCLRHRCRQCLTLWAYLDHHCLHVYIRQKNSKKTTPIIGAVKGKASYAGSSHPQKTPVLEMAGTLHQDRSELH